MGAQGIARLALHHREDGFDQHTSSIQAIQPRLPGQLQAQTPVGAHYWMLPLARRHQVGGTRLDTIEAFVAHQRPPRRLPTLTP